MIFYKNIDDLADKIIEYKNDDKSRRKIAEKGKTKYTKYFNSNLVAGFILDKTFLNKAKLNYYWDR